MLNTNYKGRVYLFLFSQCLTLFGSTLVQMAIVWYVTLATSSGVWVSAFSVCSYLPQFLLSFWGGALADRHSKKRLIIGADSFIAATTLLLALAMPYIQSSNALLVVLLGGSALRSAGAGVQTPAIQAALPLLVPKEKLMHYNGINATMQSAVQFVAPAAAGVLLSMGNLQTTLLVDIATAAVSCCMLGLVALPATAPGQQTMSIWQGVQAAANRPLLGRLVALYGVFTFLCVPGGFLAQLYVTRTFGGSYAHLTAAELVGFAGMSAGGLLVNSCKRATPRQLLCCSLGVFGAMGIAMGVSGNFCWYLAAMGVYGIAMTGVTASITTLLQQHTPTGLQGRIFGLQSAAYAGALPLGMGVFGPLADMVPQSVLICAAGAACILLAPLCAKGAANK